MGKNFNVLDMANQYAANNEMDPAEIFKQHPVSGNIRREAIENGEIPAEDPVAEKPKEEATEGKKPQMKASSRRWTPGADATADLPEAQMKPVTYAKDEIKVADDPALKNIAEENARRDAVGAMNELERTEANIEALKRRRGYAYLLIPDGFDQANIRMAAADNDYDRAQKNLDEIFTALEEEYPEFVVKVGTDRCREMDMAFKQKYPTLQAPGELMAQYHQGETPVSVEQPKVAEEKSVRKPIRPITERQLENMKDGIEEPTEEEIKEQQFKDDTRATLDAQPDTVKIIVNKNNVDQISWTPEEIEKLRRTRSLELNIVETGDLEMGEIEDMDGNAVDAVLEEYHSTFGSQVCVLPASKYRCNVTGLSYPEVLDLQTSQDMNAVDAEYKKWSIAFEHMKNISIGPWQHYWVYPGEDGKPVRVERRGDIPEHLVRSPSVHEVTPFEDFLQKTSYADLEWILWKILCATVSDREIISVNCKSIRDGVKCTNTYEWVYNANELLDPATMNQAVLDDMEEAANATSREECIRIYNTSPVRSRDTVKLPVSGWKVVFGHISAQEYLEEIFPQIVELRKKIEKATDPTIASQLMIYTVMQAVKALLIPVGNGKWKRVRGAANLEKMMSRMNQTDWNVLLQITDMVTDPYSYEFSVRKTRCPKCHSISNVKVETIRDLLFIVARSLMDVNVELKKM